MIPTFALDHRMTMSVKIENGFTVSYAPKGPRKLRILTVFERSLSPPLSNCRSIPPSMSLLVLTLLTSYFSERLWRCKNKMFTCALLVAHPLLTSEQVKMASRHYSERNVSSLFSYHRIYFFQTATSVGSFGMCPPSHRNRFVSYLIVSLRIEYVALLSLSSPRSCTQYHNAPQGRLL